MALGIRRSRFGIDATRLFSVRAVAPANDTVSAWTYERGQPLCETQADVSGGFPGYADLGAILPGAQVRITDAYVTVDEGQPQGFGLPNGWIDGFAPLEEGGDEPPLLLHYHDGVVVRSILFRFRPGRVASLSARRSARAQSALAGAGIPLIASTLNRGRAFTLPWDEASAFESEQVVWSGSAAAPVQLGDTLVASDIWLTTQSLIWGSGAGDGINRIPLEYLIELVSTRLRDRIGTPAIYLSVECDPLGRVEVPFVFNRLSPPDHNFRERAGMLDGLRALDIPDGETVPYWQPWRTARPAGARDDDEPPAPDDDFTGAGERDDDGVAECATAEDADSVPLAIDAVPDAWTASETSAPIEDEPVFIDLGVPVLPTAGAEPLDLGAVRSGALAAIDRALAAAEKPNDSTERIPVPAAPSAPSVPQPEPVEDVLLAVWSAPAELAPLETDTAIAHGWIERPEAQPEPEADVASEAEWMTDASEELPGTAELIAPEPVDPWAAIRRFEATALDALDELFHAIDRRAAGRNPIELGQPPPSSYDQARALAELAELLANGEVTGTDAGRRRERILALGDICVRLRTLIELHASGHLTDAELGLKRKKLVDGLSISLVRM